MGKRIFLCFLAAVVCSLGLAASSAAHPYANHVVTVWPEGWKFHYQDGHTSDGAYPVIDGTGETLFCLQPHFNATSGPREQWMDLAQYFGNDAAFAQKLSLTAYYSLHSGWGEDGIAVGQSLVWKYIMERDGETGEQWLSTPSVSTREQMQAYYDQVEEQVRQYLTLPEFHGTKVQVEAGKSLTLEDGEGVLEDMVLKKAEGPVQVSAEGNRLVITAEGTEAAQAELLFEKPLLEGVPGSNFAYYSEDYQDVMTIGYYEPLQASLQVEITPAECGAEIIKRDAATGKDLPGARLQVTDPQGNVIEEWVSDGMPHRLTGLKAGEVYTLTELEAPSGYATAEPAVFTAEPGSQKVVMENSVTKIQVSKTDMTGEKELSGAAMQVTDLEGNLVDAWVSDGEPHMIEGLCAGMTYILKEVSPAPGYATAEAEAFVVEDTGEVQRIRMEDDVTKTEVLKTDAATGKVVEGASLQLLDPEGKLMEEWVTSETPHLIEGLTAGETYVIREKETPDGYLKAEDLFFTVADTGEVRQILLEERAAQIRLVIDKEAEEQVRAGELFSCRIAELKNDSNTSLEDFSVTDRLPDQARLKKLRTGTFNESLTYSIYYRTGDGAQWLPLAEGIDSRESRILELDGIGLGEGERITEIKWQFGCVPAGFSIDGTGPEYWMEADGDAADGACLLNQIQVTGTWEGETFRSADETETRVFRPEEGGAPATGDGSRILVWAAASCIGMSALALLWFTRKRQGGTR